MLLTLLFVGLAGYIVWTIACLEVNVWKARRIGIPVVRLPIDWHNVVWMVLEPNLWMIVDRLPIRWSSYPESFRYLRRGWFFWEKADAHLRHGPIWALVSPVHVHLYLSDAQAIGEVFSRRRDFVRQSENYKILEVFGPCLSTADVDHWPRHRKALAAPFNESIMSFVWDEAIRQAKAMAYAWSRPDVIPSGVARVQTDTRSISLNILAATGFRQSYEFSNWQTSEEESSYRASLQTVLDNAIILMLVPYRFLTSSFVPESWRKIGRAGDSFKHYMVRMLEEETEALKTGRQGSGGIMTSLVRSLDAYQAEVRNKDNPNPNSSLAKGLSVEEIFGNIFIINFAGHDTTANTLAFALFLLASDPEVQEWVSEEIQQVVTAQSIEEGTYDMYFEKLLRCRAILYETLRVYAPIMALPKATDTFQKLEVRGHTITIPPNTGVSMSILACHTDPSIWPNALKWAPSRWIVPDADGKDTFYRPPENTFFPWSSGPQNCLGKKFAEVESVAVLAALFHHHRVRLLENEGESPEQARNRLLSTINDVSAELLLKMKNPDRVKLQYLPR